MRRAIEALCAGMTFVFALVFAACDLRPYEPQPTGIDDPVPTPVPNASYQFKVMETGAVQFLTNDADLAGGTYWKTGDYSETTMTSITVDVAKMSGRSNRAYGIVFCTADDDNFLALLINTERTYTVMKKQSGLAFAFLGDGWTFSSALQGGYNITNRLSVSYEGENRYRLAFNGIDAGTVTNETAPFFTGGRYGYIATVGSDEDFPKTSVDVRFVQVEPADIQFGDGE